MNRKYHQIKYVLKNFYSKKQKIYQKMAFEGGIKTKGLQ
jgi:hypothetical protein|tara:strand:+ start:1312 stop:1428 length:117 start_codon:yes stop_codon:yes gene_type:complete